MKNLLEDLLKDMNKYFNEFKEVQQDLTNQVFKVSGAGGMVEVEISGERKILSIKISDELFAMQDKKMLEDLIVSAVNQAYRTAEANFEEIAKSKFSNQFMDKFSDFSKFQDKE
jgi:hypothetical protein